MGILPIVLLCCVSLPYHQHFRILVVANQKRETAGGDNVATCILGTRSRVTIYNNYGYCVVVVANQMNRAMAGGDNAIGNNNCILGQGLGRQFGSNDTVTSMNTGDNCIHQRGGLGVYLDGSILTNT